MIHARGWLPTDSPPAIVRRRHLAGYDNGIPQDHLLSSGLSASAGLPAPATSRVLSPSCRVSTNTIVVIVTIPAHMAREIFVRGGIEGYREMGRIWQRPHISRAKRLLAVDHLRPQTERSQGAALHATLMVIENVQKTAPLPSDRPQRRNGPIPRLPVRVVRRLDNRRRHCENPVSPIAWI